MNQRSRSSLKMTGRMPGPQHGPRAEVEGVVTRGVLEAPEVHHEHVAPAAVLDDPRGHSNPGGALQGVFDPGRRHEWTAILPVDHVVRLRQPDARVAAGVLAVEVEEKAALVREVRRGPCTRSHPPRSTPTRPGLGCKCGRRHPAPSPSSTGRRRRRGRTACWPRAWACTGRACTSARRARRSCSRRPPARRSRRARRAAGRAPAWSRRRGRQRSRGRQHRYAARGTARRIGASRRGHATMAWGFTVSSA